NLDPGAARGELRPADLSPARVVVPVRGDLMEALEQRRARLPEGPDEDRGPGSGDRRSDRAELGGALDELHRSRVERGPMGLVDAVGESGADQVQVGALDPEHELRCGG